MVAWKTLHVVKAAETFHSVTWNEMNALDKSELLGYMSREQQDMQLFADGNLQHKLVLSN